MARHIWDVTYFTSKDSVRLTLACLESFSNTLATPIAHRLSRQFLLRDVPARIDFNRERTLAKRITNNQENGRFTLR